MSIVNPPRKRPGATLEGRLDTFEKKGPYTFAKIFQLAKACSRSQEFQAGDSLDNVYHLFPPVELAKILAPAEHLSEAELEVWKKGTDDWKLDRLEPSLSDEQLRVIARHRKGLAWALKSYQSTGDRHGAMFSVEEVASEEVKLIILKLSRDILAEYPYVDPSAASESEEPDESD